MGEMYGKSYGIADALSELLEAAVMADSRASQRSYEMIKAYAYGYTVNFDSPSQKPSSMLSDGNQRDYLERTIGMIDSKSASMKPAGIVPDKQADSTDNEQPTADDFKEENEGNSLAMAKFTMRDASGAIQELTIPQITMVPLPMLHVTEANFDVDLSVNLEDTSAFVGELTTEERSDVERIMRYYRAKNITTVDGLIAYLSEQLQKPEYMRPMGVSSYGYSGTGMSIENQLRLLRKYKNYTEANTGTGASFLVSKNNDGASSSTTNLKVNVKMKQAELPEGIRLLLQAAANSLQVTKQN